MRENMLNVELKTMENVYNRNFLSPSHTFFHNITMNGMESETKALKWMLFVVYEVFTLPCYCKNCCFLMSTVFKSKLIEGELLFFFIKCFDQQRVVFSTLSFPIKQNGTKNKINIRISIYLTNNNVFSNFEENKKEFFAFSN